MANPVSRRTVLLGAGSAFVLSACGGGGPGAAEGPRLNVLVNVNAAYAVPQQAWFTFIAEKFAGETGASIQWETFTTPNDELTRIQTSVVAGQGPDVYSLGTTFTPTAYATGAFTKLGDAEWAAVGGKDRFVPAALGISGPDEANQVGIPFASRPFVMAYNTEILAKAGIKEPATTWDELGEQAKAATSGDVYGLAVAYKDPFDPWKFIWGMSITAGNPIIDGDSARIDDPAVRTAYDTYFSWLVDDGAIDPAAVGWQASNALGEFAAGKAAFLPMCTPTSLPTLADSPVKDSYAYALLPTVPPGATERPAGAPDAASILSGDNLVVADYSANKELAFKFIELITRADIQTEYWKVFGQLPTNAEAAAALTGEGNLKAFVAAAERSVATPFTGAWGDVQLALTDVTVQTIPDLSAKRVDTAALGGRIAQAQQAGQNAVDRAR